jgi:hypothetical protein
MNGETNESVVGTETKPHLSRWLRKTAGVLGFLWWMVRVFDWLTTRRGLNRVEFPQYSGGRGLDGGRIQRLGLNDEQKPPG